ncbi:MAG TPA: hypothetical protein VGW36_04095, partial [Pyrinomonadaceae bacterium]|nr:hypothetical protein [Pyrinomonadaceae bacterium]
MTKPRQILLLLMGLLVFSGVVCAQEGQAEKAKKELERQKQLKRKTLILVDEIANGAVGLKLPENRLFILTSAADLLWQHDEKRARNLFWDALGGLNLLQVPPSQNTNAKSSPKANQQLVQQYFTQFGLRQQL